MSLTKLQNGAARKGKETLKSLQRKVSELEGKVEDFVINLQGSTTSSPARTENYNRCNKLKSEVEDLTEMFTGLSKENEKKAPSDFAALKKKGKRKLAELKDKLEQISRQLEPDEVEEDYFRKVRSGGIEGSTSDIRSLGDRGDNLAGDGDNDPEEDEGGSEEYSDEEYSGEDDTVVVDKVIALNDFVADQEGDLAFKKGDVLTVIDPREDGWWVAKDGTGRRGHIPKTFVKIMEPEDNKARKQQHTQQQPQVQPTSQPAAQTPTQRQTQVKPTNQSSAQTPPGRQPQVQPTSQSSAQTPTGRRPEPDQDGDTVADLPTESQMKRSGKHLWSTLKRGAIQETSVTDVLKAMGAMPSGFRSTTLGKMNRNANFQTSSWIVPKLSPSNLAYRDLIWDPVHKQIRQRAVKVTRLFSVASARMIPLPGTGIKILSRQIRMAIWDFERKLILSNIHSVRAMEVEKDAKAWSFSPKATQSVYDSECLARVQTSYDKLGILFELNISYQRTSTDEKSEMSCGWAVLKLFEDNGTPVPNKTFELELNGGSPGEQNVVLDPASDLKSSTNRFQSIVRSVRQPTVVVRLHSYNRTNKEVFDTLPDTILTCNQYAPFISYYRQLVGEILFQEGRNQQNADLIMDPVIASFPRALETMDVMDLLKRMWDEKNKRELKRSQRRNMAHMRAFFRSVYMESAFPALHSQELPPYLWGNSEREKDRLSVILQHFEKTSALESLLSPDHVFKPFNVDRLVFNPVSKHCRPYSPDT